jgi:hypothetical protein
MPTMKGDRCRGRGGGLAVSPERPRGCGGKETPSESESSGDEEDEEDEDKDKGEIISSPLLPAFRLLKTSPRLVTSSASKRESPLELAEGNTPRWILGDCSASRWYTPTCR